MKLKNKKTGEIIDLYEGLVRDDGEHITIKPVAVLEKCYIYNSLAELNAEWEDYEEPKEYWFISSSGKPHTFEGADDYFTPGRKEIGNYFSSREEAEKAVEKLKAWKRLKDKGFRFNGWNGTQIGSNISYISEVYYEGCTDDLDLLFGGEE